MLTYTQSSTILRSVCMVTYSICMGTMHSTLQGTLVASKSYLNTKVRNPWSPRCVSDRVPLYLE